MPDVCILSIDNCDEQAGLLIVYKLCKPAPVMKVRINLCKVIVENFHEDGYVERVAAVIEYQNKGFDLQLINGNKKGIFP